MHVISRPKSENGNGYQFRKGYLRHPNTHRIGGQSSKSHNWQLAMAMVAPFKYFINFNFKMELASKALFATHKCNKRISSKPFSNCLFTGDLPKKNARRKKKKWKIVYNDDKRPHLHSKITKQNKIIRQQTMTMGASKKNERHKRKQIEFDGTKKTKQTRRKILEG